MLDEVCPEVDETRRLCLCLCLIARLCLASVARGLSGCGCESANESVAR
jgi:hypothetical protein